MKMLGGHTRHDHLSMSLLSHMCAPAVLGWRAWQRWRRQVLQPVPPRWRVQCIPVATIGRSAPRRRLLSAGRGLIRCLPGIRLRSQENVPGHVTALVLAGRAHVRLPCAEWPLAMPCGGRLCTDSFLR